MNIPKKLSKFGKIKQKAKISRKDMAQNAKLMTEKLPSFSPRNINNRMASPIVIQQKISIMSGISLISPRNNPKWFRSPNNQASNIQNMAQIRNGQLKTRQEIQCLYNKPMFSNSNQKTGRRMSPKKLFKLVNGAKQRMKMDDNSNIETGFRDRRMMCKSPPISRTQDTERLACASPIARRIDEIREQPKTNKNLNIDTLSNNIIMNNTPKLNVRYEVSCEQSEKNIACLNPDNSFLRDSPINRTTYSKQAERVKRHKQYSNYFNTLNQQTTQDSNNQNKHGTEDEIFNKNNILLNGIKEKIAKINQEHAQNVDLNFGSSKFNELICSDL